MARAKKQDTQDTDVINLDVATVASLLREQGPSEERAILVALNLPTTEDGVAQVEAFLAQNAEIAGWRRNDADDWEIGEPFQRAAQSQLPGFERDEDPELEPLALALRRAQDATKKAQAAEAEARSFLDHKLKEKGLDEYTAQADNGRLFRVFYKTAKEKLAIEDLADEE